jgi:hypothetical protein
MRDQVYKNWAKIPASQYPALKKLERTNYMWGKERIYFDRRKKSYMHKDSLHGEVEVYCKRGLHLNVLTPDGLLHPRKGKDKDKNIKHILFGKKSG